MKVTGKSAMTYFAAQYNEAKEVRQLHSRFPKQLKKAVLMAVQFRECCNIGFELRLQQKSKES